jgi:hypothetical protein
MPGGLEAEYKEEDSVLACYTAHDTGRVLPALGDRLEN